MTRQWTFWQTAAEQALNVLPALETALVPQWQQVVLQAQLLRSGTRGLRQAKLVCHIGLAEPQ